jgi:predicted ester cyclase
MSDQKLVAIVRRLVEDVWNRHQLAPIDELFALRPQPTGNGHTETIERYKQRVRVYLTAFPDLHVTIEQLLASDEEVMVRWTLRGTHTGPLTGQPAAMLVGEPLHDQDSVLRLPIQVYPTGRRVRFHGVSSCRVEAGKITWYWMLMDDLSVLRQLGVLPVVQPSGGHNPER